MANTLTDIMPKILSRGLLALRPRLIMPRLVNGDYAEAGARKGDTINVPLPSTQVATAVVPGPVPPTPADNTPTTVPIVLDQWFKTNFHLTDKERLEIMENETFLPGQISEAVVALARAVNQNIWSKYVDVYSFAGTPGTTPFASDYAVAAEVRRILNVNKTPPDMRRFVIDFFAEENAIQLAPFRDASASTDAGPISEGEIGRKIGFDWYSDDDVPTHTAGTGTGYVSNGAHLTGDTTIAVDTGSGTIVVGDIFTFASHTTQYVVKVGVAAPGTITISPPLAQDILDADAITLVADHKVNLAFHRDAIAFVNRAFVQDDLDRELRKVMTMQDPQTGITLRLEVDAQYKQVTWEFDLLWGAKVIRPELACRLLG